jgi:hypothetical protein
MIKSQYCLPLLDGCEYRNKGPLRRLFAGQHKTYKQLVRPCIADVEKDCIPEVCRSCCVGLIYWIGRCLRYIYESAAGFVDRGVPGIAIRDMMCWCMVVDAKATAYQKKPNAQVHDS